MPVKASTFWVRPPEENRLNFIVTIVKRRFIIFLSAKTGIILMVLHVVRMLLGKHEINKQEEYHGKVI